MSEKIDSILVILGAAIVIIGLLLMATIILFDHRGIGVGNRGVIKQPITEKE